MNMPVVRTTTALSALLFGSLALAAEAPQDPRLAEAQALIKEFATTLQGELKGAIEQGGPTQAIGMCKERAPAIAEELSARSDWEIGRVSLKTRNSNNRPDDWEQKVLDAFEARRAAGEDVMTLTFAEEVETPEGKAFRLMKAIPTGEVCLTCHGGNIAPEVVSALDERYPEDQARGYSVGEIRGAFSLLKPL